MGHENHNGAIIMPSQLILPKEAGGGVKITPGNHTWRDKEGIIIPDPAGVGAPTLQVFRHEVGAKCRAYAYSVNDMIDMIFHMPHDWVPGTNIYMHPHWFHSGTNISGTMSYTFSYTYAKGHNQASPDGDFQAEKQQTFTFTNMSIATYPRYRHRIDEFQLSDAGGTGNFLNTNILEADGIIHANVELTAEPTVTGGDLYCSTIDLHYLSSNIGTYDKAPPFFGV